MKDITGIREELYNVMDELNLIVERVNEDMGCDDMTACNSLEAVRDHIERINDNLQLFERDNGQFTVSWSTK
jgi:hypothetical protein